MALTQYTAIVSEAQAETRQLVTVTLSKPANARTRVPVIQSRDDPSTLMATVTLNDPQRLNALSAAMMFQLNARLAELSRATGIDEVGLAQTVSEYNAGAVQGQDPAFGRGRTSFNRYLADPEHQPNPCVAPIQTGPFYALKVVMGDLGTFDGIQTSVVGEVKKRDGTVIPGLFAVGNDRASIMGGNYPAAGITHGPNMTFGFVTGSYIADAAQAQAAAQSHLNDSTPEKKHQGAHA